MATSPSRSPSTACASPGRSGRWTRRCARHRHFPAIEPRRSYTLYDLGHWFDTEVGADWQEQRAWALALLEREGALQEIVQIVGADALGAPEQVVLRTGRLLREDFLQQSAFDDLDAYCPPEKQYWMLRAIRRAHEAMDAAVARGADVGETTTIEALAEISRLKHRPPDEARRACEALTVRDRGGARGVVSDRLLTVEYRTVSHVTGPLAPGGAHRARRLRRARRGRRRRRATSDAARCLDRRRPGRRPGARGHAWPRPADDDRCSPAGAATRTGVGRDLIGRILDGSGRPIDDGPPVAPDDYRDVNGRPMNPYARARPSEFIHTGVSAIDGFNTLVRGQKLPIFSGVGLPGNEIAAQIAAQSRVTGESGKLRHRLRRHRHHAARGRLLLGEFERPAARERTVPLLNLADDPTIERLLAPRFALTAAEYLAFEPATQCSCS